MRTVSLRRATGHPSATPSGVGFGASFALDVGLALAADAQGREWVDVLDDPCALSAT